MCCPKMAAATCASSTSAGGVPSTCVTCGQHFWKCSGATSSFCSRPRLRGPGSCLGCCGTCWLWCTETCWVREPGNAGDRLQYNVLPHISGQVQVHFSHLSFLDSFSFNEKADIRVSLGTFSFIVPTKFLLPCKIFLGQNLSDSKTETTFKREGE